MKNLSMPPLPRRLVLDELKGTAPPGRFSGDAEMRPEQRLQLLDADSKAVWGFVIVDNTRRGPGLGGIRIAPDLTLNEITRLARTMTLKNSAACLPYGGGKAGILHDPRILSRNSSLKRDLIGLAADALFELDTYIPAPDMGTDEADIQQIYDRYSARLGTRRHRRGGAARPPEEGGIPIDDWGLTAHGVFAAVQTREKRDRDFQIAGCRAVVQGFGHVGSRVAAKLHQAGARVVGASDISGAFYAAQGLDPQALHAAYAKGGLAHYQGPWENHFGPDRVDWILEAPCDLLIPAARPDAVTSRNADRLHCRMIFQGANTPSNKMTEYYLQVRRGIVSYSDFIVNVGGVMGCALELEMCANPSYHKKVLATGQEGRPYIEKLIYNTVASNVGEILDQMQREPNSDRLFRERAMALAENRLENPEQVWL
ncbi:MAG: Glu/Leu/Phe/Val dehydrogenase [Nitrospinaceae bacterium]